MLGNYAWYGTSVEKNAWYGTGIEKVCREEFLHIKIKEIKYKR